MRMKKLPQQKKPNPHKGARLGQGWHEDYIRDSRIANIEYDKLLDIINNMTII